MKHISPRGLFLLFCCLFIFGDILGITLAYSVLGIIIFCIIICGFFINHRSIFYLISAAGLFLGVLTGYAGNQIHMKSYQELQELTHGFSLKSNIEGRIANSVFNKDNGIVYRLEIDKIDNKTTKKIVFFGSKPSIFIETPSNMKFHVGEIIGFTGMIRESLHFPLVGYDRYSYLKGGYGTITLGVVQKIKKTDTGKIEKIQAYWKKIFRSYFPDAIAGTLLGMTIGNIDLLSSGLKNIFIQSGISHILVVSGSNIAFLIVFVSFFIKYTPLGRYGRISIIGSIIGFYGTLVGWDISVIRAVIMGILSYIIVEYGGNGSSRAALGLAGVVLTIFNPLAPLYDVGFGLSFCATLGILVFNEYIEGLSGRLHLPKIISSILGVTIGAALGSLPVMIYHFGTIPVSSLMANIIISGVLGWILLSSVLFIGIQTITPIFGYIFGFLVYIPTKFILHVGTFFSDGYIIKISGIYQGAIVVILLGIYLVLYLKKDLISE